MYCKTMDNPIRSRDTICHCTTKAIYPSCCVSYHLQLSEIELSLIFTDATAQRIVINPPAAGIAPLEVSTFLDGGSLIDLKMRLAAP